MRSVSAVPLTGLTALCLATGCSGSGWLSAVPFTRNDIAEHEALVATLPRANTCVWFTDDAGRVNIVMRHTEPPLLGKQYQTEWIMGLRAGEPPAGSTLRYRVERGACRGLCTSGMTHQRFESRWGVMILSRRSGDRFRGRFHIAAAQQQFSLFTGWAPTGAMAPLLILVGEFEAVHNQKVGRGLMLSLEKEDWSGLAPSPPIPIGPASRPSTRRAAPALPPRS